MSSPSSDAPINFTKEVAWVDSSCCQSCGATSWIPWKHHCRACGGCFCQNCSSKSLALPPKHPTPVRVCDKCFNKFQGRPAKVAEAAPLMSASLPVDYFTRKIDDYSGPKASRPDPLAASMNFDPGDSPKAKWLTDRPASYYYSAPPVEAVEEEEEAGEEEVKDEEKTEELSPEKETDSSSTKPATVARETQTSEKEANQAEEAKNEQNGDDGDNDSGEEKQIGANVERDNGEPGGESENEDEHAAEKDETPKGVAASAEGAYEVLDDSSDDEVEDYTRPEVQQEAEVPEKAAELSELELSGAEAPIRNVNTERGDDEASAIDETSDTQLPEEPKLSARIPADEEVMELKESIKRTEEEDKEEKEKMAAIQNKLKNMQAHSFKERLEVGSLVAKELSSSIFYGLRDSLRVKHATISIQKSNRVYNHIIDTLILNGPLLLFMYILFKYLFEPHFHSMLNFKEHSGFTLVLVQIMEFLLKASFLVLWVGPIYVLSVVLNMQWSQEVGNGAFSLYLYIRRGKTVQKASKPLSDTIAQIIYWQVIFGVFNLLNFLCKFVPIVGPPFYFICLCWLNAVYCFDYKWGNQKWSLHKKISYCETRWLYFIGFGLPITLATFFFEYIISYSLVSLLFPMFIPMAMYGSPKTQSLWKPIPMSRFLDSSIIAPLIRFIFTLPSQVEKLEQKADTIVRFLAIAVCSSVVLGVVTYLLHYLVY